MSAGGYSGTPLWKKLGLKPGGALRTIDAPGDFDVPELPEGARLAPFSDDAPLGRPDDVILAFFASRAELADAIEPLSHRIFPDGSLWVAWPRRAAGHESDIREQDIRDLALPLGIVDVKVAAIDADWSGLRLVWRRELRDPSASG